MPGNISIINKTNGKIPVLPFERLKNEILSKKYELSIAFVGEKKSKGINNLYRKKNKSTNILSFALTKNSGELILCPSVIKKETKKFDRSFPDLLGYLVIHGILHLKGMTHGAIMDRLEKKYDTKYNGRHRHRHLYDQSHSGRVYQGRKKS